MKTTIKNFATALILFAPLLCSTQVYAAQDVVTSLVGASSKITVCHATGSIKNPWQLTSISTSALQTHLAHGDSATFVDLGKNNCKPGSPPPPPPPAPSVTLTLDASAIDVNATTKVNWDSTHATQCTLNGTPTATVDGSLTVGPYTAAGPQVFSILCSNAAGVTATATTTLTVKPLPLPTVSLTLNPTSIKVNAASTATWDSTNATSCSVNGGPAGAADGSTTVGPFSTAGAQLITVVCTGAGGTATDTETLTVNPLTPPTVTLTLAQNSIRVNTTTTVTWDSTDATSCTLNGAPTSSVDGETTVGPFGSVGPQQITIACVGADGSTSDTKTLTVEPALPTVNLTLDAYEINVGATTNANWSSTNATSCTLNGQSTSGILNGSKPVGPYLAAGTVPISVACTGAGGTVTATQTLRVIAPPLPATSVLLCAHSLLGSSGAAATNTWVVRFDLETQLFEGISATAPVLLGGVEADPTKPVAQAFFAPNTQFAFLVGTPTPTVSAIAGISVENIGIEAVGPLAESIFIINLFAETFAGDQIPIPAQPTSPHTMWFTPTCPEMENQPPPPER